MRHSTKLVLSVLAVGAAVGVIVPVIAPTSPPVDASVVIQLGSNCPSGPVVVDRDLWVGSSCSDDILKVDVEQRQVTMTEPVPIDQWSIPSGSTSWGQFIWFVMPEPQGNSHLVEVDAATGRLVRDVHGSEFDFDDPGSPQRVGGDLWVTEGLPGGPDWLTSIDGSTGKLVRTVSGARYHFDFASSEFATALAVGGGDIWVANSANNSLTEVSDTGKLIRVVAGARYGFTSPASLAYSNGDLWITNTAGDSVIEISAVTAAVKRIVHLGFRITGDGPMTISGPELWIATGGNGLTGIATASGRIVLNTPDTLSKRPWAVGLVAAGGYVWVTALNETELYGYKE